MDIGDISIWSLVLILVIALLLLLPAFVCWPIAKRAGYSKWWPLLMCLPMLNVILVWFFAFSKWPIENA